MNRKKRFAVAALAAGAAGVAGCCGIAFSPSYLTTFVPEAKIAEHAVAAEAAPEAPKPEAVPDLGQAKQLLADGKKFEARALLTKLILAAPEGPDRENLRAMLEPINKDLFFGKAPSPDCISYEVQYGETLSVIAKRQGKDLYFTEVIMLVNDIHDPMKIRPRQTLKIPQGKFSAIVQKSAHRLIILLGDHYIKEYPVGLGAPATPTPEGSFVLDASKAKDPDWTAPDGQVYKFKDPKNILGTRWLAFKDTPEHHGLGIHGTSDPTTIGKDVSNGCVRLANHDVEEIFGMLAPEDTVEIRK